MSRSHEILFPTKSTDFINTLNFKLATAGEKLSSRQWSLNTTTCSLVTGHGMVQRQSDREGWGWDRKRGSRRRKGSGEIMNTLKAPCYLKHDLWTGCSGILTRCTEYESTFAQEPLVLEMPLRIQGTLGQCCDRVSRTFLLQETLYPQRR